MGLRVDAHQYLLQQGGIWRQVFENTRRQVLATDAELNRARTLIGKYTEEGVDVAWADELASEVVFGDNDGLRRRLQELSLPSERQILVAVYNLKFYTVVLTRLQEKMTVIERILRRVKQSLDVWAYEINVGKRLVEDVAAKRKAEEDKMIEQVNVLQSELYGERRQQAVQRAKDERLAGVVDEERGIAMGIGVGIGATAADSTHTEGESSMEGGQNVLRALQGL